MRKTNKRPDGTEEILEGDPEELRKYEDLQKPQQQPITEAPKKPDILHGGAVDGEPLTENEAEWVRFLRKFPKYEPVVKPIETTPWVPQYPNPIWITYCSTCCRSNCFGGCWQRFAPVITYGATTILTSDKTPEPVSIIMQDDGSSRFSHGLADILSGMATVEVKTNGN